jgi:diadenosine tetraphosphatase ApaH/serine/threonine PP2A family protein phosphatase
LDALTLLGNHDAAVLGQIPLAEFREGARRSLEWTKQVLTPESCAWLHAHVPKIALPGQDLTLVHASPRSPIEEYIVDADIALENMEHFDTSFCFFGHTHQPVAYRLRTAERILRVDFLPENRGYQCLPRLLLNPGSVGQPRDGDPRAAYALFDTASQILTSYRVAYDIAATQRAMERAGLPYRLIARLEHGA